MSEQNCGNCRFWKEDSKDSYEGRCRRYPPSMHFYSVTEEDGDVAHEPYYSDFPTTVGDQWCGEHQPINQLQGGE